MTEYIMNQAVIKGDYRYRLTRQWDVDGDVVTFIMLNPSTADSLEDDPTIRRCVGFAKRWGFGQLDVVNLFALRATDPKKLALHDDPIGPANIEFLRSLDPNSTLVAAWGANSVVDDWLKMHLFELPGGLKCLGTTKKGYPRHPLYVKGDTPLQEYHVGMEELPSE